MKRFMRAGTVGFVLALAILFGRQSAFAAETWDGGQGSAATACRAKLDESGTSVFSHVEIKGDVGHCFTKAKDGSWKDSYDTAVYRDSGSTEEQAQQPDNNVNKTESEKQSAVADSGKTCKTEHPKLDMCYGLEGKGLKDKDVKDSKNQLKKDITKTHPNKQASPKKPTAAELCESGQHWNYYVGKDFVGSIVDCECCIDTQSGSKRERRSKYSPN